MDFKRLFRRRQNTAAGDAAALGDAASSTARVLSFLEPEVAFKCGLSSAAIAGIFRSDDPSPDNFVPNSPFVELLHRVIRQWAPQAPGFASAAAQQGDGSISIIDLRTPEGPQGRVPPEDIVGAFGVSEGKAVSESYHPNPNYRVYTCNGLTKLPPFLHLKLLDELRRLAYEKAAR